MEGILALQLPVILGCSNGYRAVIVAGVQHAMIAESDTFVLAPRHSHILTLNFNSSYPLFYQPYSLNITRHLPNTPRATRHKSTRN